MDVLYFHKHPPLQKFGVLIALSIVYSVLSSAYVLPTFLILWVKWKKKRGKGPEVVEYEKEHEDQGEGLEDHLGDESKGLEDHFEDDEQSEGEKENPEDEPSDDEKEDKLPSEEPESEELELKVKED